MLGSSDKQAGVGVAVRQETDYPNTGRVLLKVDPAHHRSRNNLTYALIQLGYSYALQCSTNLTNSTGWQNLKTNAPSGSGWFAFTNSASASSGFYRLKQQ